MKVKGFGGVFLRSKDKELVSKWYKETLGIPMEEDCGAFITPDTDNETIFSLFEQESDYFPKEQSTMLNFQVEDIEGFIEHFKKIGVKLLKEPLKDESGTFITIVDPEGRWIELWER